MVLWFEEIRSPHLEGRGSPHIQLVPLASCLLCLDRVHADDGDDYLVRLSPTRRYRDPV